MHEPQTFNWLSCMSPCHPLPVDIKVEPSSLESSLVLLSPTPSSSASCSAPSTRIVPPSVYHRRSPSHSSIASPKRVQPYPSLLRETHFREEDTASMSASSSYGAWSSSGKSNTPGERRSSHPDQQSSLTLSHAFELHSFMGGESSDRSDHQPQPSSSDMTTSSLTGAVGNPHVSRHFRRSNSPSPKGVQSLNMDMQTGLVWASNQTPLMAVDAPHATYTQVAEQVSHGVPYPTPSQPSGSMRSLAELYPQYHDYGSSTYKPSPGSLASQSPYAEQHSFQESRGVSAILSPPNANYNGASSSPSSTHPRPVPPQAELEHEIQHLRTKVRDLELINESTRARVSELERQLAADHDSSSSSPPPSVMGGPLSTPSPFKSSWKARTDARLRQFCSLNRAGNALCAWHDSRRERRAYPPRMAPKGHLNCGCTYEEALFEESLARHNVGSYHPGETVRMDPALRNPLLRLLQTRYGYRDGDFERDQNTGDWVPGEGPACWEFKAQVGGPSSRKSKGEYDRR